MTKIIIVGAKGRMGQALIACAARVPELQVTGRIDVGDDLKSVIGQGDVVIEFSAHDASAGIAALCAEHSKALVVGTTGHSEADKAKIANLKSKIPIVMSSNFSTGVNTLFWLTRKAAEILGPDFDLEVVEMHHRMKKDAPSGTATTLAGILADVRKQQLDEVLRHGRAGHRGRPHVGGDRHARAARRRRGGRPHGHLCGERRTGGVDPQGVQPRHFRQRRPARRAMGGETEARTV